MGVPEGWEWQIKKVPLGTFLIEQLDPQSELYQGDGYVSKQHKEPQWRILNVETIALPGEGHREVIWLRRAVRST